MKRISKRLFPLALALVMLIGMLPVTAVSAATCDHVFDNSMDADCNNCGVIRWVGETSTDVLNGKAALFAGDSITYGFGADGDSWAERIGTAYGMTVTNAGVNGATLSDSRAAAQGTIDAQLVEGDFDYVILQGGINDATDAVEIGNWNASRDPETFKTETFAGGLDRLFQKATALYPNAKIGFIITYHVPNSERGGNSVDADAYWAAAKEYCAKWDIAFLDMNVPEFSEGILETSTDKNLSDDIHLNAAGYDVVTPYIASWMATLVSYDKVNKHADDGSFDVSGDEAVEFDHVYHNACDAMCYDCGEVRVVEHEYEYPECSETCLLCGLSRRDVEHTYDDDADVDCNLCGAVREVEGGEEICEHAYDNACDATCNLCGETREAGDHEYSGNCDVNCDVCGAARVPVSAAHAYTNESDAACNVCGATREITSSDLKPNAVSLSLASSVTINFKVNKKAFDALGYTGLFFKVEFGDGDEMELHEIRDFEVKTENGVERYIFKFRNVNADRYVDTVRPIVCATFEGRVYECVSTRTTSVRVYTETELNKETGKNPYSTMLVDLLNYGAEAQKFTGRHADDLANKNLSGSQASWGSTSLDALEDHLNPRFETVDNPGVLWRGASLKFADAVTLRYNIPKATDLEGVVFKFWTDTGREFEWEYDAEANGTNSTTFVDPTVFTGGTPAEERIRVCFKGLNADEMRAIIYVAAYKDGVQISNTAQYSIVSFAASLKTTAAEYDVVMAMMKYGDSAYAFTHQ